MFYLQLIKKEFLHLFEQSSKTLILTSLRFAVNNQL